MSKINVWQYLPRSARLRGEQYKIPFLFSFSLSLSLLNPLFSFSLSLYLSHSLTHYLSISASLSLYLSLCPSVTFSHAVSSFISSCYAMLCCTVLYVTWRWSLQNARHPCLPPPQGRSQQPLARTDIKKIIMRRRVGNWVKGKRKDSHKAGSRWILQSTSTLFSSLLLFSPILYFPTMFSISYLILSSFIYLFFSSIFHHPFLSHCIAYNSIIFLHGEHSQ